MLSDGSRSLLSIGEAERETPTTAALAQGQGPWELLTVFVSLYVTGAVGVEALHTL